MSYQNKDGFHHVISGSGRATLFHTVIQGPRSSHLKAPSPTLGPQGPFYSVREREQESQMEGSSDPGLQKTHNFYRRCVVKISVLGTPLLWKIEAEKCNLVLCLGRTGGYKYW